MSSYIFDAKHKTNRKPFKKAKAKNSHCIQRMTTTLTGNISSNDGGGVKHLKVLRKYVSLELHAQFTFKNKGKKKI